MTNLTCPNCGTLLSAGASFCPNCGYRFNVQVPKSTVGYWLLLILFAIPSALFGSCCFAFLSSTGSIGSPNFNGPDWFSIGIGAICILPAVIAGYFAIRGIVNAKKK